jgi:gluconate 2-dehydrogenase gamma chain
MTMHQDRRSFLAVSGSTLAAFWFASNPDEIREALKHARRLAADPGAAPAWEYLTAEQAADVEAFASQIFPSEPGSPGATEAGVVYFVDRSLATWGANEREPFTRGLDELNGEVAKRWPGTARFAALSPDRQVEIMRAREKTDFFGNLRGVTLMAIFGNPSYGGNRDKIGWRHLGFEDRYAWQPPFGDYDATVNGRGGQ